MLKTAWESFDEAQRACTEFIEVTNGRELISLVIFRSAEPFDFAQDMLDEA